MDFKQSKNVQGRNSFWDHTTLSDSATKRLSGGYHVISAGIHWSKKWLETFKKLLFGTWYDLTFFEGRTMYQMRFLDWVKIQKQIFLNFLLTKF